MNKDRILWLLSLILVVLVIMFVFNNKDVIFVTGDDGVLFKNEYERLNYQETSHGRKYPEVKITYNDITYISFNKLLEMLEYGTGVVYIGYAECLYCRRTVQVLTDTAKKNNLDNLYYLDVDEVWNIEEINDDGVIIVDTNDTRYNDFINRLDSSYLKEFIYEDTDTKKLKVPLVLFIAQGEIVSWWSGTLFSHEDPYKELSDYQVTALEEIYYYGINDVINASKW